MANNTKKNVKPKVEEPKVEENKKEDNKSVMNIGGLIVL